MEKISIIVPVYNVEDYLDKCIESLTAQSYKNIEIILVDDGSKDKSGQICDEWSKRDERIQVIHKENGGVSSARNKGIAASTGEWLMFIDGDDYCERNMLQRLYESVVKDKSDFAYCSFYTDRNGARKANELPIQSGVYNMAEVFKPIMFGTLNALGKSMSASLWTGIFSKRIIESYNIAFDAYIRFAEDWLFYAEYITRCKKVSIINEALYNYVQRATSVMHEYVPPSELAVKKSLYILDKFCKCMADSNTDKSLYELNMTKRYINFVINQAKSCYNRKNNFKLKEKSEWIRYAINELNIDDRLNINKLNGLSSLDRIFLYEIRKKHIMIISLYVKVYNILRDLKRK